jgi:hypothetical protein
VAFCPDPHIGDRLAERDDHQRAVPLDQVRRLDLEPAVKPRDHGSKDLDGERDLRPS